MTDRLISELKIELGKDTVVTGDQLAQSYNHIWTMDQPLKALALICPTTTQQVSSIMKICHRYNQPCLLYTSPSPRDATLSRMPSSA